MPEVLPSGQEAVDKFAGKDLNNDGNIVNLVVCGNSRFYQTDWVEHRLDQWVSWNSKPDLVILGGASGVDSLVEKWATENHIQLAIFNEAWNEPRIGEQDTGRPEASPKLGSKMLDYATHVLAFPGPKSKWTTTMINKAIDKSIPLVSIPTPTALD
tara:strand:- start:5505 stop:5972 length:468 start_codon:yes stop_codon:yes gene_type:complete